MLVGLDKMSLLDYEDKISCVLFYKACNFRCPFCHNGLTVLEANTSIDFNEALSYLKTRVGLIDAVVFTGGEPTLEPELKNHIKQVKELGFLVKLDTNGTNPEILKDLIESKLIDYVAMDIKNNLKKYPLTTGVNNINETKLLESIHIIMNSGVSYEFRTTLVNEFHSLEDMEEMGQLIKGAEHLYLQKFVERDGCIKKGLHEVSEDLANKFKDILSKYVKCVELRGY
ncbi:MAG: anaerobic ribonucleoside-triphosphate reductase activating protein [Bacilli bacterium]|nr:anaerobic ribonucleoside-triphosphate reductase activating protein [Bacilli bacterium]